MASVGTSAFEPVGPDVARAAELRRIKALATLALGGALVVLILARVFQSKYPVLGFVAAFAEAALIGGLADWYAVVALFRHPLGLPIPHTAVIPENQAKIAEKLGEFIELHFLSPAPVEAKLNEIDFASFAADWLKDQRRSSDLARFVLRLLPDAMDAAESSGLKTFLAQRLVEQIQSVNIAPLAAGTLRGFIDEGRHQPLLNDILVGLTKILHSQETLAAIRQKIRDELPTLLNLYAADAFLVKKIAATATSFFEDVHDNADHPFRDEFHRMILSLIDKLDSDPAFVERIELLKNEFLARPELGDLARNLWENLRKFIDQSAIDEASGLHDHLAGLLIKAGIQLESDLQLRAQINGGIVAVLRSFIAEQKSGVSTFISDQVKAWDMKQLVALLELNVGKDLQYIRFNGTLIGGLAGLALYAIEQALRWW